MAEGVIRVKRDCVGDKGNGVSRLEECHKDHGAKPRCVQNIPRHTTSLVAVALVRMYSTVELHVVSGVQMVVSRSK